MSVLESVLASVEAGEPRSCRNLTMVPLRGAQIAEPDYTTLDHALSAGTASVREVTGRATVPELQFANAGDLAVLLLDGEELVGAMQNRVLNVTVLAPPHAAIPVPVSCVEEGRWHAVSPEFRSSDRVQYAEGRARKTASVAVELRSGGRGSDQGEIWEDISAKAARMAARSDTGAMATLFERHSESLEQLVMQIQAMEGECGALFLIGGKWAGLDLFDCHQTFERVLPKLVRSYGLDAVDRNGSDVPPGSADAASPKAWSAVLEQLRAASAARQPATGEGEDVSLTAEGYAGLALEARGRVVHLAAFPMPVQRIRPSRMARAGLRRAAARARQRA